MTLDLNNSNHLFNFLLVIVGAVMTAMGFLLSRFESVTGMMIFAYIVFCLSWFAPFFNNLFDNVDLQKLKNYSSKIASFVLSFGCLMVVAVALGLPVLFRFGLLVSAGFLIAAHHVYQEAILIDEIDRPVQAWRMMCRGRRLHWIGTRGTLAMLVIGSII